MRDERRASDLKELHVHFEANLSTRAWHVFKNFAKTVKNTKNRSIRIVFQCKFTIKPASFLAVEFPEVLENFAESPWPE